jgi:hypothetical protein
MKVVYFLLVAALATSCSSDLESLKDEACACKGDLQCLSKLEPKMKALKEKLGGRQPTEEEAKVAKEMVQCMMSGLGGALKD